MQEDEEWNEFETDKEVDLSTLKIQNLGEKYEIFVFFFLQFSVRFFKWGELFQ